ncbi:uncharacterized protein LTR77_008191 [Saxophila tyrrhenica]|uniref:Uncharacterized protein n=1 Tax=Saxophila tyrrhenica TaxID=1690608 RepID=A0AAV9P236_9PEZI|nr:hypothetical protein LTR77_008191 [Saxophila tyrrhenica]
MTVAEAYGIDVDDDEPMPSTTVIKKEDPRSARELTLRTPTCLIKAEKRPLSSGPDVEIIQERPTKRRAEASANAGDTIALRTKVKKLRQKRSTLKRHVSDLETEMGEQEDELAESRMKVTELGEGSL